MRSTFLSRDGDINSFCSRRSTWVSDSPNSEALGPVSAKAYALRGPVSAATVRYGLRPYAAERLRPASGRRRRGQARVAGCSAYGLAPRPQTRVKKLYSALSTQDLFSPRTLFGRTPRSLHLVVPQGPGRILLKSAIHSCLRILIHSIEGALNTEVNDYIVIVQHRTYVSLFVIQRQIRAPWCGLG